MNNFGIYAWPAYSTKELNPYNYIIYKHIEEQGYPVHDFYFNNKNQLRKIVFSKEIKILHIHWPTSNILKVKNFYQASYRLAIFYLFIKVIRLMGKKVLWTVHNLEEHETVFPWLVKFMNHILYNNVDGFIAMNKKGTSIIRNRIKTNHDQKVRYIKHPHYRDHYKNTLTKEEARDKLGIPDNSFVFLFVGQIRTYKNLPALISAFKQLNDDNSLLLIAGRVNKDLSKDELCEMIGDARNIRFFDAFIKEDDVQVYLNAADLVVNPYSKIFTSGSIFLNLSFNKPTLAPEMFAITELKNSLGRFWIKTYKGELTARVLKRAMGEVKNDGTGKETVKPDIDKYDPQIVARNTIEFYKSFLS